MINLIGSLTKTASTIMANAGRYDWMAHWVKMGGTVFFFSCFMIVLIYVFWPKNKAKFERAAHQALGDESLDQEVS